MRLLICEIVSVRFNIKIDTTIFIRMYQCMLRCGICSFLLFLPLKMLIGHQMKISRKIAVECMIGDKHIGSTRIDCWTLDRVDLIVS